MKSAAHLCCVEYGSLPFEYACAFGSAIVKMFSISLWSKRSSTITTLNRFNFYHRLVIIHAVAAMHSLMFGLWIQ